jgi:phosphoesterase RecJ-like protein
MSDFCQKNISKLALFLQQNDHFVVTTHNNPDGDALGSSTAFCYFLHQMGKTCTLVLPDAPPASLSFLFYGDEPFSCFSLAENPVEAEQTILSAGALVCLDFNGLHRTKCGEFIRKATCPKLLIDHHLDPERENFDIVLSQTQISSACECVYQALMALPQISNHAELLPARTAYALMTGMTTDTNNFANSVYPSTLRMASALLEAGVDRDDIIQKIYFRYRENRLRAQGYILNEKLKISPEGVAYVVLSRAELEKFDLQEGETEGFVNIPLSLDKVCMSILIREYPDRYRVSIRSKKGTSANMWARMCFNGGGHENASGGNLDRTLFADASQVEEYVESAIAQFFAQ